MNVKLARIKKGLTQAELRELIGVSPNTLVQIEKGNYDNVKIGLAKKIAKALDSTVTELFFND
ncbi:helix-turn-helix domain-containing protein [Clostridium sporogenes]|uniref:helix-turn-helix transcriptional regulator n=1 Tax=Clostridium sporogenes TaxID=1509 RepID=UPI0013CDB355|nr:helix-turn-helix domain-containing protein [Clostridium sporogenes]NFT04108.1 helix-turn-helix domain-containing protein [Clostridium sporogenes]NFT31293.1 helix-turn-helix domain-containing protein [Clostridium sporogenes]NFT39532.1 helix-turn-helix domain-containing protein [Clostridium sporogenes]NFT54597.1 helix-turn-helix domain-containing protein [Clostridium sporogenes]NFT75762.1 helix-turn-helix domain-containing protein [Clostridium sporogenes]